MNDIERKARDLRELIDQYWDLAYAEGLQRRDQDTADGDAQRVSMEIDSAIRSITALSPPEDKAAEVAKRLIGRFMIECNAVGAYEAGYGLARSLKREIPELSSARPEAQ